MINLVTITKLEFLKMMQAQKREEIISKLLTDAGVPEWVEFENTPGSSVLHRLKWFLVRRKSISKEEARGECLDLNKKLKP